MMVVRLFFVSLNVRTNYKIIIFVFSDMLFGLTTKTETAMKLKCFFLLLFLGMILCGCSWNYRQDSDGVTVRVQHPVAGGPNLVRLDVLGEKIIRVSATPENKFTDNQSLVVLPQNAEVAFTVLEHDGILSVETASVCADVSLLTGEVLFKDPDGRIILQEQICKTHGIHSTADCHKNLRLPSTLSA